MKVCEVGKKLRQVVEDVGRSVVELVVSVYGIELGLCSRGVVMKG